MPDPGYRAPFRRRQHPKPLVRKPPTEHSAWNSPVRSLVRIFVVLPGAWTRLLEVILTFAILGIVFTLYFAAAERSLLSQLRRASSNGARTNNAARAPSATNQPLPAALRAAPPSGSSTTPAHLPNR